MPSRSPSLLWDYLDFPGERGRGFSTIGTLDTDQIATFFCLAAFVTSRFFFHYPPRPRTRLAPSECRKLVCVVARAAVRPLLPLFFPPVSSASSTDRGDGRTWNFFPGLRIGRALCRRHRPQDCRLFPPSIFPSSRETFCVPGLLMLNNSVLVLSPLPYLPRLSAKTFATSMGRCLPHPFLRYFFFPRVRHYGRATSDLFGFLFAPPVTSRPVVDVCS